MMTAIILRPLRCTVATMLRPEAQTKPVFMPVVPANLPSSLFSDSSFLPLSTTVSVPKMGMYWGKLWRI
ncbi:hypothetical protein D9M68_820320 [compost metagenome]